MQVTVRQGQSLADIALQYHGNIEAMFTIAALNNIRITEGLRAGDVLQVPGENNELTNYFAKKGVVIACTSDDDLFTGIDYMAIEIDFIVE